MERSKITRDSPIAKAAYSFLKDYVSSTFSFPEWNKGRIICQKSQLKRMLASTESSSEGSKGDIQISISNTPIPFLATQSSTRDTKRSKHGSSETKKSRTSSELLATAS